MRAQLFDIVSHRKSLPFGIAAVDDFELAPAGVVDAQEILANANILLYCLEPQSQQAIFVRVPDLNTVLAAPFYYISQYEHATQVLKISYQTMELLANQVELDEQHLVLIYSMGRSGTTLTSSAFSQAQNVVSISEPDVMSQLVQMLDFSGANKGEISRLVRPCLLLTCKNPPKS